MVAKLLTFTPHVSKRAECCWVVLLDGQKTQLLEKTRAGLEPVFDAPIDAKQLEHELRWHIGLMPSAHDIVSLLKAWLCHAYLEGRYSRLILVAPTHALRELHSALPHDIHRCIKRVIQKDLTYCSPQALAAYFSEAD